LYFSNSRLISSQSDPIIVSVGVIGRNLSFEEDTGFGGTIGAGFFFTGDDES